MIGSDAQALLVRLADGEFHSAGRLAGVLGKKRDAVWRAVRSLRDAGLALETSRRYGYRLPGGMELLDAGRIREQLGGSGDRRELTVFPVVDSTNRWLARRGARGAKSGAACLAECQTAGRGRRGRRWVSPFGANLYLSMLWRFDRGISTLGGLSLAAAVGAARALAELGVSGVAVKWPNDLYFDGRKLAGTLVEASGESAGPCRVVAGLGLNVRMPDGARREVGRPLADLGEVPGGEAVGRNALATAVIRAWDEAFARFQRDGLGPFLAEFRRLDMTRGRPVTVLAGARRYLGTALGVDERGRLRVSLLEGERAFTGGEVSLEPGHGERIQGNAP